MSSIIAIVQKSVSQMGELDNMFSFVLDNNLLVAEELSKIQNVPEAAEKWVEEKQNLLNLTEELINIQHDIDVYNTALVELVEEVSEDTDLESALTEKVTALQSQHQDPKQHSQYLEIQAALQVAAVSSSPSAADESANELVMTEQMISTIDPLSKQEMTDPVRNKHCGHSYERKTILSYINSRKGRAKCPIPSCRNSNHMRPNDLETDEILKQHIKQMRRQKN